MCCTFVDAPKYDVCAASDFHGDDPFRDQARQPVSVEKREFSHRACYTYVTVEHVHACVKKHTRYVTHKHTQTHRVSVRTAGGLASVCWCGESRSTQCVCVCVRACVRGGR